MADVLDQQYNPTTDANFVLRFSTSNGVKLAQSFTPSVTAPVGRVSLKLKKTNAPTGNIWVSIQSNSGGNPSGAIISQSVNVDVSTLSTSFGTINFDFLGGTQLVAGTLYWIVLEGDYAFSPSVYAEWATKAVGVYSGGEWKANNGTDWAQFGAGIDSWFDEYYDLSLVSSGFFALL